MTLPKSQVQQAPADNELRPPARVADPCKPGTVFRGQLSDHRLAVMVSDVGQEHVHLGHRRAQSGFEHF